MTTTELQPHDASTASHADHGMDLSGYLLPELRDTVREKIFTIEPLCREDNELARQVERFISLPGVSFCEGLTDHFVGTRAFFGELRSVLNEMLPFDRLSPVCQAVDESVQVCCQYMDCSPPQVILVHRQGDSP